MANNLSSMDNISDWFIDRYTHIKARLSRSAPRHIGSEITWLDKQPITLMTGSQEEQLQKMAVFVSWIFSNIISLGEQCSGQPIHVKEKAESGKYSKTVDHPLAKVFRVPNEFMPFSYLIRHLLFGLSIGEYGAFWYLAPDKATGELAEIWPIDPNRIKPIKDPNHYVRKFLYTAKNPVDEKSRQFFIDARYVFWIKYPNPWDYWKSLPPLLAAFFPAKLDRTIENNQERIYSDSRGVPLSMVSLDKDLSEPDFEMAKEQIIHDWQDGEASIAITRAGQVSVQSLGFTYEELQTIGTQEITRDKIDAIFFGYAYRSEALSTGEGLKQMDRIIKEHVIHPLLVMIQESFDAQIVRRFYPTEDIMVEFNDPRTADRALNIQESMIASRWMTINEMREKEGSPPITELLGIDIGNMPVSLGNNPALLMAMSGLSGAKPQYERTPDEVGNLSESRAPEAVVNEIIDSASPVPNVVPDGVSQRSIMKTAMLTELGRWKTVSRRNMERNESRDFETDIIPVPIQETLKSLISTAENKDDLVRAFDVIETEIEQWIEEVQVHASNA